MKEWFIIDNVDEIDSPALVVYPDRARQNIELAKNMVRDPNLLRPHVKTNKSPDACRLLLSAGIKKFKCATIAEAEMLAMCGAPDVLLAYQTTGPKLKRLINLIKEYPGTNFSAVIDNMDSAFEISQAAIKNSIIISLFIDLNTGMNRTGIIPESALELYRDSSKLPGITMVGLHSYDGHFRDPDINIRSLHANKAFEKLRHLAEQIKAEGFPEPLIVAGGSPTFPIHAERGDVECSPGTFIYWDKGYIENCPEQKFIPAALVITRVISLPDKTKVCLDLGHKSIAAENDLARRVYFLNSPFVKPVSQSEEHLVMEAEEGHGIKVGDVFYGIPFHICPTVALYERAIIVSEHNANGEWENAARNRTIGF